MHAIKRIALRALAGCLALCLAWCAAGRASAPGDDAVEGAYTPIPLTLWEDENDAEVNITTWALCMTLAEVQFCDGDILYYDAYQDEQGELCYRTIDVSTMQVSEAKFPPVFGEETILDTRAGDDRCHVLTDSAVYTFDTKLALVRRTPLPAALREIAERWVREEKQLWSGWDVNPSGTAIVYRDTEGLKSIDDDDPRWEELGGFDLMEFSAKKDYGSKFIWTCALEPDAVPQRVLPTISRYTDYFEREGYWNPYFIGDDRFFVANYGWEWATYNEVWNLDGQRLYRTDVVELWSGYPDGEKHEAEDAHGLFMHNPSALGIHSSFYFDYGTLQLERLPVLSYPPYNDDWLFCAVEGRTCIFAMAAGNNSAGRPASIDFYRYTFDTETVEVLPFALHDVYLVDAALAPGGRIVFLYGKEKWRMEHAGVFQIP